MTPYIIKALQKQPSVHVNDLGTFTVQYQSAKLQKSSILPPRNVLVFDNTSDHDEIAFTNLVCQERQCLLTQGNEAICKWVDELKNALQNNKSICFENFGTFSLQNNGTISFESDFIPELNTEFEGMGVVDFNYNLDDHIEETVEPIAVPTVEPAVEPVIEPTVEPIAEPTVEPVAEPTIEPVIEPTVEPVAEPTVEPVAEPTIEPVIEPTVEPTVEPVVEEVATEPIAEETNVDVDNDVDVDDNVDIDVDIDNNIDNNIDDNDNVDNDKDVDDNVDIDNDIDDNEEGNEDVDDNRKGRKLWWLFLLIILIALGTLAFAFKDKITPVYQQLKEKISHKTEQTVPEDEGDAETTDLDAAQDEPAEEVAAEPTPYTPTVLKTTADGKYEYIQFESGHYYAIGGSFPTEGDALRHIRQTGLDQYAPKLVLQDGVSNIRICIGIFDTEEEAESFAKNINPKFWVLK